MTPEALLPEAEPGRDEMQDRIAELQYQAGMYQSLYEAALERLRVRSTPADQAVREADNLCELLRQFIMEFWIDKPQMTWKRTRCDDGLEMVHHDGDTIFFGDPNHKEPSDAARFDLIVQLANATPRLLRSLTTEPKR